MINTTMNQPRQENHYNWQGGKTSSVDGYVLRHFPDHPDSYDRGYILEHRLIMAEHIGRRLIATETVHHKNGNRTDNRIENLELRAGRHGKGSRYEDLSVNEITQLISYLTNLLKERSCNGN